MRLKFILSCAVLVAILIAGCGGSDSSSSGGSSGETGSTTTAKGNEGGKPSKENGAPSNEGDESTGQSEGSQGSENESSGANEEATSSKPLTKTELNTKMNEICIQVPPSYEEFLKEEEKKSGKKLTKEEQNLKAALPPIENSIKSMEILTPRPAEEQDLEETIEALKAAATGLEEEPNSKLSGAGSPFAEFQEKAKEFGYSSCEGL